MRMSVLDFVEQKFNEEVRSIMPDCAGLFAEISKTKCQVFEQGIGLIWMLQSNEVARELDGERSRNAGLEADMSSKAWEMEKLEYQLSSAMQRDSNIEYMYQTSITEQEAVNE